MLRSGERENDRYEMPAWQDFLGHIARGSDSVGGADSVIILHPHAPREGLEIAARNLLNIVMVFPQTFTLNSNGWIYSIDDFFERFDLSDDAFDPVQARMRADKEEILSRSGYSGSEDISDLLLYASSVDAGSRVNAKNAAQRFGFGFVKSAKNREKKRGAME